MTSRFGTLLAAAALTATVGTAAAQGSGSGAPHFERFSQHEINICFIAQYMMIDLTTGEAKDRYLASWVAFSGGSQNGSVELVKDRADLLRSVLSDGQLAGLADACGRALQDADGPARFALPYPDRLGESAFSAYRQSRAGNQPGADPEAAARADATRLDGECRSILDAGVEQATRNFRQAQSEIQVWIRAGAFGSAPGSYDIQNGCSTLGSTISALNAKECPADYANAVARFRSNYYISFGENSAYSCQ